MLFIVCFVTVNDVVECLYKLVFLSVAGLVLVQIIAESLIEPFSLDALFITIWCQMWDGSHTISSMGCYGRTSSVVDKEMEKH